MTRPEACQTCLQAQQQQSQQQQQQAQQQEQRPQQQQPVGIRLEPLPAGQAAKTPEVYVNGFRSKAVRPRATRLTLDSASPQSLSSSLSAQPLQLHHHELSLQLHHHQGSNAASDPAHPEQSMTSAAASTNCCSNNPGSLFAMRALRCIVQSIRIIKQIWAIA